jgi:hypothetical protein
MGIGRHFTLYFTTQQHRWLTAEVSLGLSHVLQASNTVYWGVTCEYV